MRVLVTGANGFIGRHLCPRLTERGHRVTAAVRSPTVAADVADYHPRVVGDIGPETDWQEALKDQDAVIHTAARVHVMEETEEQAEAESFRVNADGTRRLVDAAVRAGLSRFLYLSSVKAAAEVSGSAPLNEKDQPCPEDAYGRSKLSAERALRAVAEGSPLETVILRPPLVYGPGAKANILTLFKVCANGTPLPLGAVNNQRSLLFVGNLADAIVRCLEHPEAAGRVFYVRDGQDLSTPELVRRTAAALGRPARLFPLPVSALRLAARLAGKAETVERLTTSLQVDDKEIRSCLSWTPPIDMVQGFAETAAWFVRRRRA